MYRLLLAVPFLIGVAVLQGLTVEIDTFHGSDAGTYQLPTILQLSERLDLSDYPSAQTPLFHLLMAGWGELVGFELWKLRLLNVVISYGAALALLRLLRRATPLGELPAFALTLAFVLSPYYFGASFTLLTDNLAILLGLVALERVHAHARTGSPAAFALACLAIGAAVFTRQSFLWLVPVAAFFLLRRPDSAVPQALGSAECARIPVWRRALGLALLGLALAPLAALVVEWNGLVPPSADPASCGLCTDRPGVGRDALTLRTVGFTMALLG
ncbi:MAG: glycosyltransferase family 39 protein, partial [Thermoleophilaceae bacterium]